MKKLGLICLILIIALGAVGVGYAAFNQPLNNTNSLNTGYYAISWGTVTGSTTTGTGTVTVGTITSSNFQLTIGGALPAFTGTVSYTINNTGSIPAKVISILLTAGTGVTIISGSGTSASPWIITLSGGTSGTTDVQVYSTVTTGTTLAANTSPAASGTLVISVPSGLSIDQGATGTLTFTINTQQNP
jgi:hypothetical protein